MKTLYCRNGEPFIVDDEDFDELSKYNWYYSKRDNRVITIIHGVTVPLPRIIMPPSPGLVIDHINGNRMDNRKCNLQAVSVSVNCHRRRNTHGFKGVSFNNISGLYYAQLKCLGKRYGGPGFVDPVDAAKAYDALAIKHYGIQALTNESLGLYSTYNND